MPGATVQERYCRAVIAYAEVALVADARRQCVLHRLDAELGGIVAGDRQQSLITTEGLP